MHLSNHTWCNLHQLQSLMRVCGFFFVWTPSYTWVNTVACNMISFELQCQADHLSLVPRREEGGGEKGAPGVSTVCA